MPNNYLFNGWMVDGLFYEIPFNSSFIESYADSHFLLSNSLDNTKEVVKRGSKMFGGQILTCKAYMVLPELYDLSKFSSLLSSGCLAFKTKMSLLAGLCIVVESICRQREKTCQVLKSSSIPWPTIHIKEDGEGGMKPSLLLNKLYLFRTTVRVRVGERKENQEMENFTLPFYFN